MGGNMKKITVGRDYLGDLAPQFAAINDDILFGQVWAREDKLSPKERSMITISALMGAGINDQSLKGHLESGKENGITKSEIIEIVTQLAFYTGWPKGWAVFAMVSEVYQDDECLSSPLFGLGEKIDDKEHFNGNVYVKDIFGFDKPMLLDNVTFEPRSRNNWHIHQAGQTLFVLSGHGWYQEDGKPVQTLKAGDIVDVPAGVKHWHGASKDSWFTHLAIEDYSKGTPEWLEAVDDTYYNKL
jgi:4-carboxymuconolactone decarboxylase